MAKPAGSLYAYPGISEPASEPAQTYQEKITALFAGHIVTYFPISDASGTTMTEAVNGYDGVYSGVALGETGIGDGNTAGYWDGTDYAKAEDAPTLAALPTTELTVMAWIKAWDAALWTDATNRRPFNVQVDSSNIYRIRRASTNNTINCTYVAGGTTKNTTITTTATDWIHVAMTISKTGDALKAYLNGVQSGSTVTGLGTWAGTPTLYKIGASSATPSEPWKGWIAHVLLLDYAASADDILTAATV